MEDIQSVFPEGIRGLIFDCDGVLVDSKEANIAYYNRLRAEFGHPPMEKALEEPVQMGTVLQAFTMLFTQEEVKKLPEILQQIPYSIFSLPLLKLETGLRELLDWCYVEKILLAVHTNRNTKGILDLLENFCLRDRFDLVMSAEIAEPKPSPDGVQRILNTWNVPQYSVGFIGDSAADAGAAAGAGVPFLAYRNPSLSAAVHISDFSRLQETLADVKNASRILST